MKLILDFQNDGTISFMTNDDPDNNYYLLVNNGACRYSLFYNNELVWNNRDYATTGNAVSSVIGKLIDAMKVNG